VVFAPQDTMTEQVVRVAGTRWTVESGVEAGKGEGGLDHYEVRSLTGWHRHMTLAMWALALLTVLRAGALAVAWHHRHMCHTRNLHGRRSILFKETINLIRIRCGGPRPEDREARICQADGGGTKSFRSHATGLSCWPLRMYCYGLIGETEGPSS
jgi:hypothetical protein